MLIVPAGGGGPVVSSFPSAAYTSSADASEFTFSSKSFGAAAGNRYILAFGGFRDSTGTSSIDSCTIAGVSATQLGVVTRSSGVYEMKAYIAAVPTGTTGDIVWGLSSAVERFLGGHWRVVGLQTPLSAYDTATNDAGQSGSLDVKAGGAVFAAALGLDAGGDITWTAPTEKDEVVVESTRMGFASDDYEAAETNKSVSCSGGLTQPSFLAVSMR